MKNTKTFESRLIPKFSRFLNIAFLTLTNAENKQSIYYLGSTQKLHALGLGLEKAFPKFQWTNRHLNCPTMLHKLTLTRVAVSHPRETLYPTPTEFLEVYFNRPSLRPTKVLTAFMSE